MVWPENATNTNCRAIHGAARDNSNMAPGKAIMQLSLASEMIAKLKKDAKYCILTKQGPNTKSPLAMGATINNE